MRRNRVRTMSKSYTDPGPDLLRPAANAVHQFGDAMGKVGSHWYTRRNPPGQKTGWTKWAGPIPRREVLERADGFTGAGDGALFQAGRIPKGSRNPQALCEMRTVEVKEVQLQGVNEGAEMVADLFREQFPGCAIGGFDCREYNGIRGSGWSDHAWGDAVDLVVRGASSPGPNDKATDWCIRMAKYGCFVAVQQFIGSRGGRVGSVVSPSYGWTWGGPSSHLTHVHCSYRQHYGANPHCS
jgi:hypothetical protein